VRLIAGPAGCTVATRLAESSKRPKVLLLDAGGHNEEKSLRVDGDRWLTFMMNPNMNWGYKTAPQNSLNGREIGYDRGKGLGGSSAINFCLYDIGPRDDFEEIARLAGDEAWGWKDAQKRFKAIENYHGEVPKDYQKYLKPHPENHGTSGKIHVGFPQSWERTLPQTLDLLEESGMDINLDINSGDPIGWGPAPSSAYNGIRSTSADMLSGAPANLTVLTEAAVQRIIFNGKTAIGVQLDGESYYASREVILSAGSLDTPKLLLLSGVGPSQELKRHQIPLLHDLPYVGRGLRDHIHISMVFRRKASTTDRPAFYKNPEAVAAARAQWEKDQTGPLAELGVGFAIGFMKNERIYQSEEFQALSSEEQRHLLAPTVPSFEVIAVSQRMSRDALIAADHNDRELPTCMI
jgi:choline dehydrogenase-like flavoprotein